MRVRESGKSVSGGVFECVSLCVFLAGCALGFHYTRTLPPGALSLSPSLSLFRACSGSVKIPQGLGGQQK